jgi:DNA modification methylase
VNPVYDVDGVRIYQGDVRDGLRALPAESVHCCITSPPYWSLRSYLPNDSPDKHLELGSEKTLDCLGWATKQPCGECFICNQVAVFEEVRRVLRHDATLWLNIGDSFASGAGGPGGKGSLQSKLPHTFGRGAEPQNGLKQKDLCMQPARLALALQAAGWYIRSDIIWHKPAPMPESVTDRPTKSHEYLWLLTKRPTYFYDCDAIREPHTDKQGIEHRGKGGCNSKHYELPQKDGLARPSLIMKPGGREYNPAGRNKRSVWTINSEPSTVDHYASFPTALVKPCILAGTSEKGVCPCCGAQWVRVVEKTAGISKDCPKTITAHHARGGQGKPVGTVGKSGGGRIDGYSQTLGWKPSCTCPHDESEVVPATVLDPFAGTGTTLLVAKTYNRRAVGIELNPKDIRTCRKRLAQSVLELTP